MTEEIRQGSVLEVVLLNTIAEHPDGISTSDAYDWIAARYTFPEEWYREIPLTAGYERLKKLGYRDWRDVPQDQLVELVPTEVQWRNKMRWARNSLRERGYLDTKAERGIWRLTSAGMQAAGKIALASLAPEERKFATPKPRSAKPAAAVIGLRESLMSKLGTLTSSMPLDDLDLLVDIARSIRMRSLTSRSA